VAEKNPDPVHNPAKGPRRHDLDALRAIAMLLGICLHAMMPYTGEAWVIMDNHASRFFFYLVGFIHGFRMQLFFLVSGFFTAMLASRGGPAGMLKNRAARILLPLGICVFTLIPLTKGGDILALSSTASHPQEPLFRAIKEGDIDRVGKLLDSGPGNLLETRDLRLKISPLGWAVLWESESLTRYLLELGARPNEDGSEGFPPLSIAALLGRLDLMRLLANYGGDPFAAAQTGVSPWKAAHLEAGQTRVLIWLARGEAPEDLAVLEKGRQEVRDHLRLLEANHPGGASLREQPDMPKTMDGLPAWVQDYFAWLASDQSAVKIGSLRINLLQDNFFGHLWFLFFLWWLCLVYAGLGWLGLAPGSGTVGNIRLLYPGLVLAMFISFVFQGFMSLDYFPGTIQARVGADLSVGLIPKPHVFLYYAVFFFFGCWYHGLRDGDCRLGRCWRAAIPIAALVLFPLIFATEGQRLTNSALQTLYTWLMVLGSIGFAHWLFRKESRAFRYVADASYWLYLIHLPLVILLEWQLYFLPMPAFLKVILILAVTVPTLLYSYQVLVRHTVIGRILNGKNPNRA